ncbi:MAG: T9SS type A sorting domain-containing protein [Ignavibacteria bacterium]|nr:T9SS type A sorting domain-containing protein [Ignavibacteria bacterium]
MKKGFLSLIIFLISFNCYSQIGWYQVQLPTTYRINTVYFVNENTGFAAGGSPTYGVVFKTTNCGVNWNVLNTGCPNGINKIVFVNQTTGFLIGGYNPVPGIYKTTDLGNYWIAQNSGTNYAYFDGFFINPDLGYLVGDWGSIRKTTNGGNNWLTSASCTNDFIMSVYFPDVNTGYAVGRGNQIIKTTDGGSSWFYSIYNTGNTNWLTRVKFFDLNTGYVTGFYGRFLKTSDGGSSWLTQVISSNINFHDLYFFNNNTGYICGMNGTIYYTNNGGTNWLHQTTGIYDTLFIVHFVNANTGFAAGANGKLLRTTNGGFTPVTPTLVSPANGSHNVSVTPELVWNNLPTVLNYKIQISTTPNFYAVTDSAVVDTCMYNVPPGILQIGLTYFWRVCANYSYGVSNWSSVWNFATTMGPSPPNLILPLNNSVNLTRPVTSKWAAVSNAVSYTFQLSSNSNFNTILDSVTLTDTVYQIPDNLLNAGSLYYWRVRSNGTYPGGWSDIWNFSMMQFPSTPVLLYPPNGAVGVVITPMMDWANATNATSYRIEISTVSNFIVLTDSATTDSSHYQVPFGKLQNLLTYFWRVKSINQMGSSSWSSVWMFTVYPSSLSLVNPTIPVKFDLYPNYPNPFNPVTKIKFDIPNRAFVNLSVYDVLGREIENIISGYLNPGTYEYVWNAGKNCSGFYFIRFSTKEYSSVKKMLLIK